MADERLDEYRLGQVERRQEAADATLDEVPLLRKEVAMLSKSVDRLTNTVLQAGIGIVVTGILAVITALILKGVIG